MKNQLEFAEKVQIKGTWKRTLQLHLVSYLQRAIRTRVRRTSEHEDHPPERAVAVLLKNRWRRYMSWARRGYYQHPMYVYCFRML